MDAGRLVRLYGRGVRRAAGRQGGGAHSRFGAGYLPSHMLVVGDTLGDAALAGAGGRVVFPILPGREEACWQRLAEEGFPKFLHGSFAGAYEDTLRKAQRSLLP